MDLKGKHILVLSPESSSASWVKKIQAAGGRAIAFPTIDIKGVELSQNALEEGQKLLCECDWIIFLSQQAVNYLPLSWHLVIQQYPPNVTAIGPATQAALLEKGISTTVNFPGGSTSETVLEEAPFQANRIQQRTIALLTGEGGRTILFDVLTERGAIVHRLPVYRRVLPIRPKLTLEQLLMWGVNVICVTSAEALENLLLMTEPNAHPFLKSQFVLVLSERLKNHSKQMGFEADKINLFRRDFLAG
ncbi:MAG: uroporphyrinogen-III synthase [Gammaproteobacteria bacterium]